MKKIIPILCTLLCLTACTPTDPKVTYQKITPKQAYEMMGDDAIILDVRTQEEFDQGHIEEALLIPNTEIADNAAQLLPDKDATLLIYCRSGNRSAQAAKALVDLGYTNVYDFGGIIDWPYETVK